MQFRLTLTLMVLTITVALKAQTLSEVLNNTETPIFYYGIDFTKAKLIGDDKANPQDIVDRQFAGLNNLMLKESEKYDIAGAFRRSELQSDLSLIDKHNSKVDPDNLTSSSTEDFNHLSKEDIASLIKEFDGGGKSGTGLIFVVDGMSKYKKALSIWVTLFDIKSKNILLTERLEAEVGMGFSFRNYWATGFKKIIDKISNTKYKEWKSNLGK